MPSNIHIQLDGLKEVLSKQNITFEVTEECINFIKKEGFDPQFGARPLKRVIRRKIMDARSLAMLEDKVTPGSHVVIDAKDNKIVFHQKP